jgi:aminopeptidase N
MESDLAATFVAGARVGAAVPLSSVFGLPGAEPVYPPDLTLEPTHLHARVTVDVPARHLSGRVTTTVRANAPAARELTLHAVDFAEVAVTSPHALTWRYDGEAIALRFDEPVPLGQERVVEVSYRVADPVTGLFFSAPTAANPGAPTFAATDHETERARHWLPCVDLPAVRPTVALSITSEARFTILATGVLQSEVLGDDGLKTAHYRLDQPCPSYLTCFVLGDLVRCDHGEVDGVPIASFASTNHTPEHLVRTFGATPDIMRWLVGRLGHPFPYPKYFQFAVPGIGGAMENISLTSWDDKFVLDERLAAEWGWLVDDINVHEMARRRPRS